MSKRLCKYIASFYYFDKSLIVLFAINGAVSIASFTTITGAPVGIATLSYNLHNQ